MGTELGGGGLVTPQSLKIAQDGMRRVLAHIGLLQGPVPAPTPTRLTELGGDDYYVYASDGGLFEPLVDLGDMVARASPRRASISTTRRGASPRRCPSSATGLVLCKRVPARCERGDCLFHLATDLDGVPSCATVRRHLCAPQPAGRRTGRASGRTLAHASRVAIRRSSCRKMARRVRQDRGWSRQAETHVTRMTCTPRRGDAPATTSHAEDPRLLPLARDRDP
jgi:hypothetical protein